MTDKSSSNGFVLRQPSLADVHGVASVLNTSFARDPGTVWVYSIPSPGTSVSPTEMKAALDELLRHRAGRVLRRLSSPQWTICAFSKETNEAAGCSIWQPPVGSERRPLSLSTRVLGGLLQLYDGIMAILYPNWLQKLLQPRQHAKEQRIVQRFAELVQLDSKLKQKALPPSVDQSNMWTLLVCGVSDKFERRGIGKQMVQWGCDKADETDAAVLVAASDQGVMLYKKCGFQVVHHEPRAMYNSDNSDTNEHVAQTYLVRWPKSAREG